MIMYLSIVRLVVHHFSFTHFQPSPAVKICHGQKQISEGLYICLVQAKK